MLKDAKKRRKEAKAFGRLPRAKVNVILQVHLVFLFARFIFKHAEEHLSTKSQILGFLQRIGEINTVLGIEGIFPGKQVSSR